MKEWSAASRYLLTARSCEGAAEFQSTTCRRETVGIVGFHMRPSCASNESVYLPDSRATKAKKREKKKRKR